MVKKISLFIVTLLIAVSISLPAFAVNSQRVVDNAELLTEEEERELSAKLNSIYESQQFDTVIVTVKDCEGKTDEAYADDYYDYNGYGYGDNHDGCLLLIRVTNPNDRYAHISTTGYGITAITDYGYNFILDQIIPSMKSGDYNKACNDFASYVEDFVIEAKSGEPYDVTNKLYSSKDNLKAVFTSLIVGLIVAAIVTLSVKKSYKPVGFNRNAANYLVNDSMKLRSSYDNFLYANVTKTRIERDSGSGGSSTHSGSSGTSHGGGGRSF